MRGFPFVAIVLLIILLIPSCHKESGIDYRQEMRDFVVAISKEAKSRRPDFAIIVQNGVEIISMTDDPNGRIASEYISAIDGQGQEDLFFGYAKDDKATASRVSDYLKSYLSRLKNEGKEVFVTDYCSATENIELSRQLNSSSGFVSFQATSRNLDVIPPTGIQNENADTVCSLRMVKNFLYIIDPEQFATKQQFIDAVCGTNYDMVIMDLFLDGSEFTSDEIARLHVKKNGGMRMVVAYMSIGEAEDYRYYWDCSWKKGNPVWLDRENPRWKGNYKVRYWNREWQDIIFGNRDSYLSRIMDAGFDGVYLDIIDAFEFYE